MKRRSRSIILRTDGSIITHTPSWHEVAYPKGVSDRMALRLELGSRAYDALMIENGQQKRPW